MKQDGFPQELLSRPSSERLRYFASYIIAHPMLKRVDEDTRVAIQSPAGELITLLVGPTGVGKSTLRRRVTKSLIEAFSQEHVATPGRIPVVVVKLPSIDDGNFDWTDYYVRALRALREPLIDKKIGQVRRNPENRVAFERSPSKRVLRWSLEEALEERKPAAVIIDEAQHLAKMATGRTYQHQLDTIKSLADYTKVPHVLIGTYDLLPFRNLNGQLARRTNNDIHFSRYLTNRDDIHVFNSIIANFQRKMPLREEPNLLEHADFLYERSIGCVGILKDWLDRALDAAYREDSDTLLLKHIEVTALSVDKCVKIVNDAKSGEDKLQEVNENRNELRELLSMDSLPCHPTNSQTKTINDAKDTKSPPKRKRRVGQRKPKRDKIGRENYGA